MEWGARCVATRTRVFVAPHHERQPRATRQTYIYGVMELFGSHIARLVRCNAHTHFAPGCASKGFTSHHSLTAIGRHPGLSEHLRNPIHTHTHTHASLSPSGYDDMWFGGADFPTTMLHNISAHHVRTRRQTSTTTTDTKQA